MFLCSRSIADSPEKIVNVNHEVPHNFDAVRLELTTTLDEDMSNESFGIR